MEDGQSRSLHCWEQRAALGSPCSAQHCGGGFLHINICPVYKEGSGPVLDARCQAGSHQRPSDARWQLPRAGQSGWLSSGWQSSTASCDAIPVLHHPACPAQALPFASSSSTSTISRGPLAPARIIACNYSCCAVSSEASLGRIAALLPIPSGHLKMTAASSEELSAFVPSPRVPRTQLWHIESCWQPGCWDAELTLLWATTKNCPTRRQQRPHTFCKNQRWMWQRPQKGAASRAELTARKLLTPKPTARKWLLGSQQQLLPDPQLCPGGGTARSPMPAPLSLRMEGQSRDVVGMEHSSWVMPPPCASPAAARSQDEAAAASSSSSAHGPTASALQWL